MTEVAVKVDAREVLGFFDALSKQAPFAISMGVNETMKLGQKYERQQIGVEFTLRRKQFIERTVKILQFANKRTLTGIVGIDPTRDVLAKFEDQGVKRPTSGTALAVPIAVKRTKGDIVVKAMRVRSLQLHPAGHGQLKGLHGTFAVKGPTGGAIMQRIRARSKGARTLADEIAAGSVRVAYAFKRSVPIPKNLEFTKTILEAVNDGWERLMGEAWDKAVRTAR